MASTCRFRLGGAGCLTCVVADKPLERMPPLTYQFHLDPAETVRASRSIQRRQRFAWTSWAVWPLFLGMAALYLATGVPWQDLWLLGLAALFVGALTALTPWIQRRQLRRA